MKRNKPAKVIHKSPGKKGKVEVRTFDSIKDAIDYVERNKKRLTNGKKR